MTEQEIKLLIEEVVDKKIPVGTIICYSSSSCPDGYLPCDGRELMQSQYPDLYKVIGKTFGGSTKSFCLPDLRGRFVRGWDADGDTDPEREFGSPQDDAFQGHSHELKIDGELESHDGHTHDIHYEQNKFHYGTNTFSDNHTGTYHTILTVSEWSDHKDKSYWNPSYKPTDVKGSHSHKLPNFHICEPKSSTFGQSRIGIETRPKNLALFYCIKVK